MPADAETMSIADFERKVSEDMAEALEKNKFYMREFHSGLCRTFDAERAELKQVIEEQTAQIQKLSDEVMKLKIQQGGASQSMELVRQKLALTFGSGQSNTRMKHLQTQIVLHWRAYAKGKVERKKLYHVARAIYGRALKFRVMNAWIGYHTGTSRDKERQGAQVYFTTKLCA